MAEPIMMPRQGQSVETCIITRWIKSKGDRVEEGDLLFSYETDKAAFDETAPVAGILLETLYEEGDEVPVLSTVAVIGEKGEDISSFLDGKDVPGSKAGDSDGSDHSGDRKTSDESVAATGASDGQVTEPDTKIRISPRARRMAAANQLHPGAVKGTGPNGRIIVRDVEAAINSGTQASPSADSREPIAQPAEEGVAKAGKEGDFTDVKLTQVRRIIADRMQRSLQMSAQLTHHTSADARSILQLRKRIKTGELKSLPPATNLNDLVCYAVVQALREMPEINAHFLGDRIRTFGPVHLGIAVDTERGLMVPALRNAERYNAGGLGDAIRELAESCREGTVDPDLLAAENATFTVSNLGIYDIEMFTPVLNLPQCGILGVNKIIHRPAELEDGTMAFIPHMGISLTYDHRALDGAPASRFLQLVKQKIETLEIEL